MDIIQDAAYLTLAAFTQTTLIVQCTGLVREKTISGSSRTSKGIKYRSSVAKYKDNWMTRSKVKLHSSLSLHGNRDKVYQKTKCRAL